MAQKPIPRPDGDFNSYANHYVNAVKDFWSDQGLDPADLGGLDLAITEWVKAYPPHIAAQAAAMAARQRKDAARVGLQAAIRPVTAFIQGYTKTTDADRATIGITVREVGGTPTRTPTSRPVVRVDARQRLQHRLRFVDESSPLRRAKPKGTAGAEVWLAVVGVNQPPPPPPPSAGVGPSAYRYVELSSRGESLAQFGSADAGKQACYALRWVSPRGEKGPWSEVCSATVAA